MPRITKLIDDATLLKAESELKRLGNYSKVSIKLKAIIAAKKYGIAEVARIFDITRASLTQWIKILKQGDASDLLVGAGRGVKPKLNDEQQLIIRNWLELNPNLTINRVRLKIFEELGVDLSMATVHRIMQDLSYSYITPRPKHYKQDPLKQEEFKKKSKHKNTK